MTPEQIERVFGRGRLKMATGEHVEVFREAVAPGERRRYTKRFLNTREGDFGQWTEREWRILARLIGHGVTCVPEVVQFDRGFIGGSRLVQTYDAGVTVDQWATLLPVARDGGVHRHVFEDCAHWWALAHHCLSALDEIHGLELVHLDVKGDNVCIPYAPASFDPHSSEPGLRPVFAQFALIDFAFALVSREMLTTPLPIGWQKEYDYQSPRLLAALEAGRSGDLQHTRDLDWRCDMYSLAAMLKRYLPDARDDRLGATGWTPQRYDAARALILAVREAHDAELAPRRPHAALMDTTGAHLRETDLAHSLERGWSLAHAAEAAPAAASPLTPVTQLAPTTRIATPVQVLRSGRTAVTVIAPVVPTAPTVMTPPARTAPPMTPPAHPAAPARPKPRRLAARAGVATLTLAALVAGGALFYRSEHPRPFGDDRQPVFAPAPATARTTEPQATISGERPADSAESLESSRPERRSAAPPVASATATKRPMPTETTPEVPREALPAARASSTTASSSANATHPLPPIASPAAVTTAARAQPSPPSYRAPTGEPPRASRAEPRGKPATSAQASAPESAPAPQRSYAPWASLQPPAWIRSRSHSPGDPPGYKAHPDAQVAISPDAAKPADTLAQESAGSDSPSLAAATEPRTPRVPAAAAATQAPQPASLAPAADAVRGSAQPAAMPLASDERRAAANPTGRSLFASRSAAPVEDRSQMLSAALAPAAPAILARAVGPSDERGADDHAAQAQRLLADTVPRGEAEVSRVLLLAASAYRPTQDKSVADAARTTRIREEAALPSVRASANVEARRLHNQARAVFASGRNVREAIDLQLRAFSANPRDPEIAGYLAVLYLKTTPPQPDLARQAALMALTARSSTYATTRLEDWQTFAVASALAGRETDAKNALLVTLALSNNVERTCVAGWNALANYGDRMRGPLDAMLYRVHMRGHSVDSPWCAYPPDFSAPPRLAGDFAHP